MVVKKIVFVFCLSWGSGVYVWKCKTRSPGVHVFAADNS